MAAKRKRAKLKNGTRRDLVKPASAVSLSPPRWDQGATGPANRIGLVTEERGALDPDKGRVNPNGVKGARRVDMLEIYHARGWISDRGYTAGETLRDAWAGTQRGKGMDYTAERVDSTPKPDASIDIQIDRVSRLVSLSKRIHPDDHDIIYTVAYEQRPIAHLRQYRGRNHEAGKRHLFSAFERLADALG